MGNTASSSQKPNQTAASTAPKDSSPDNKRHPRRRESVPALPNATRAAAAPPSASLESAQGQYASPTSRSHTSHTRGRSQTTVAPVSKPLEAATDLERSVSEKQTAATPETPTKPVQVPPHPVPTDPALQPAATDDSSPNFFAPSSQYGRPPRLPLPIEEEVLSPGSPIISPSDLSGPIGRDDEAELPRRSSVLSSTTADEEEVQDDFQTVGRATGQMVDTLVEWKEGGDRVYVTGSFSGWNKKHRLHRNGPSKDPNALSAVIPLLVGAHHMTFLVDGQMRTSTYLPTAVDYTNVLINYVEVSPDEAHKLATDPGSRSTVDQPRKSEETEGAVPVEQQPIPDGFHPPQTLPPPTPDLRPTHKSGVLSAGPSGIAAARASAEEGHEPPRESSRSPAPQQPQAPRRIANDMKYHNDIPTFLVDLDAPEESHRFARASAVLTTQPTPPSLPMFLNKSILNATLPMKDDASVLTMPNHTVLNHLATTSIKQNVLATSATTRYKRKYVTTIFHKPTNESGD